MFPEIQSIRYPFSASTSNSSQEAFMRCIKAVQIWVYTEKPISAYVTSFSPTGIEFTIYQQGGQTIAAYCNPSGRFSGSDKIETDNSFVRFSSPVTESASCQLPLLSQTLCQIPNGLKISICPHPVQKEAQSISCNSDSSSIIQWKSSAINVLSGYNFQPSGDTGLVLFSAAGVGTGSPTSQDMRRMLFPGIFYPNDFYDGLRSINGITDNVSINVTGSRYLQTNSIDKVTTMTIKKVQEAADEASS